ncbi:MAG: anaerobic ribonucleoside triphosphate reductase [Oscillospiraceae bacterium]|nr:anaerobic ribonucleoside triphosphate reductase [Oscillospiraceae bacterium]
MCNRLIRKIIKRDGRIVSFDVEKIADAIFKSAVACGGTNYEESLKLAFKVVEYVRANISFEEFPFVEDIQDCVEKVLVENGHAQTAKKYILYRANRTYVREMNSNIMQIYGDLTFKSSNEIGIKRENANIDADTSMGTMLKYGSEGAKIFYKMHLLKKEHTKAHDDGDIHIHDLDFYALTTTCCQIDIIKLFEGGFSTGHGFLREPSNILSYSALACIAIQSNQNDQHGGQSIPNFDYAMAIGVKKSFKKIYKSNLLKYLKLEILDKIKYTNLKSDIKFFWKEKNDDSLKIDIDQKYSKDEFNILACYMHTDRVDILQKVVREVSLADLDIEVFQAMESFIHNLNTMHSRAGAQVPFSSINYGTDTSVEGRLVIKNILKATEKGLGNGETPIFPIQIFKVKEEVNFNKDDINYDLFIYACRVSAKRLFPNFSFLDSPFNKVYYKKGDYNTEVAYMGCRTRVVGNNYDKENEIISGRGNLSFTSINLPRLALRSNQSVEVFMKNLDDIMEICFEQLIHRFNIQSDKKVFNYPFLMGQGIWIGSSNLKNSDRVGDILKHGTLSIGFIGLAECLKALIGMHHGENQKAQDLGIKIISFMRKKIDEKSLELNLNFSLIATPAEGLSGRFIKLDKKRYGIIAGVTDREYYTNSFHIPVYYNISAYDKIKKESFYHTFTNGGHITYIELDGDPSNNIDGFEKIIRYMKECGIGYGSINHPIDRDPICGYSGIINDICPKCGRDEGDVKFERIRRITGYLVGTLDRFNDAKKSEESNRVKHN